MMKNRISLLIIMQLALMGTAFSQVLNSRKMLDRFDFWHNKDWSWYQNNIPFLETPDRDIDLTWYYRWELITDHLVYGSPADGYAVTEFIDRPWWSGTYGAISCAAGHQLYEMRWLRDPVYANDYARYFFKVPGAQPRNYSTWLADAVWQLYKTYYDRSFVLSLLDDLEKNYRGWEKEHYVPGEGMFAWDGMHDGMETNINSRQTKNWFSGAPGYRPTINSYMWADAKAIAGFNELKGDLAVRDLYLRKADTIKRNFLEKCWDPRRSFFFHRFLNDEEGGIKAGSLTYETGKYAGNPHGREEIGFIPWYFNMPDPGYEVAWKYLMDTAYFYTPFGPVTVEKNDPLFNVARNCCAWSGNAWPYATSQTLKGMANLLKYYPKGPVTKEDYFKQLQIFALTHRKDDQPYIAEANDPVTGSWSGHDHSNHSEHYFHSSYIDLIVTGLVGLEPMASDSVEVHPLIPDDWDYFALDRINYHGHSLSVVWDRTGRRYKKGKGLTVWIDGKKAASTPTVRKMVVPVAFRNTKTPARLVNHAVNNSTDQYFPKAFASFPGTGLSNYHQLNDGQFFYYRSPANRWTTEGGSGTSSFAGIDFGTPQPVEGIKVYFIDDATGTVKQPATYYLEYWEDHQWRRVSENSRNPLTPSGGRANWIKINEIITSRIRVVMTSQPDKEVGISEIEAWGRKGNPGEVPEDIENAAYYKNADFSCSYTSSFDNVKGINDGIANPAVRWTAFNSTQASDWVAFSFHQKREVSSVYLYFYNDNGGVQPPRQYEVEYWDGTEWKAAEKVRKLPQTPIADLNLCSFSPIVTGKIRIVVHHQSKKVFSGLYEVEIY